MIILPTGHEETTARRWPVVSIFLVVSNILIFVLLLPVQKSAAREVERPFAMAVEQLVKHPYLTPPPFLQSRLKPRDLALLSELREKRAAPPAAGEQERLDELAAAAEAAIQRVPSYRFGYRPADKNWLGLLTHQFLHGGWLHLIGNLWFLWLAGYVTEDRWGRWAFAAFYLTAGVVGGVAHHLSDPHSVVPLIGASGAIAGLMGAFLVRHAKTKIKFWLLLIIKPIRFQAPAYVMLPLWFLEQLVWGLRQGDGVAYFAHVGGFAFGVVAALIMRQTGAERRLDQAIENRGAILEDPLITELAKLIDDGQPAAAAARLELLLRKEPRRIDAWLELVRAATVLGDLEQETRARLKLIELYLQQNLGDGALALYEEWNDAQRRSLAPPSLRLRIGKQYERSGHHEHALHTFYVLHTPSANAAAHDWNVASAAMLAHAELALKLGLREEALQLFQRAAVDADPQFAQLAKQGLQRASLPPRAQPT